MVTNEDEETGRLLSIRSCLLLAVKLSKSLDSCVKKLNSVILLHISSATHLLQLKFTVLLDAFHAGLRFCKFYLIEEGKLIFQFYIARFMNVSYSIT